MGPQVMAVEVIRVPRPQPVGGVFRNSRFVKERWRCRQTTRLPHCNVLRATPCQALPPLDYAIRRKGYRGVWAGRRPRGVRGRCSVAAMDSTTSRGAGTAVPIVCNTHSYADSRDSLWGLGTCIYFFVVYWHWPSLAPAASPLAAQSASSILQRVKDWIVGRSSVGTK